jgi:hypothetical protein
MGSTMQRIQDQKRQKTVGQVHSPQTQRSLKEVFVCLDLRRKARTLIQNF